MTRFLFGACWTRQGSCIQCAEEAVRYTAPFMGKIKKKSGYVYADTNVFRCFTCNASWDVVAFYAQANELWKPGPDGEDVLDMGRALAGLKEEYGVEYERPAWETRFRELKETARPSQGYQDFQQSDREQMARLYLWTVSRALALLSKGDRVVRWESVRDLLDRMEDLDLEAESWKDDLNDWRERATLVTGGANDHDATVIPA